MDWTGQKYLDQFVDDGLHPDATWDIHKESERQIGRLLPLVAVMRLTRDHPGRLPESAGRDARKEDKLNAKRAEIRLYNALRQWTKGSIEPDDLETMITTARELPDNKTKAAQMEWYKWWTDHKVHLTNCIRETATNAKASGRIKEGNKCVNRLTNEYRTLDEAFGNLTNPAEKSDS